MNCPCCELGALVAIQFKSSGKNAHVCESCETFWYADEKIQPHISHSLRSLTHPQGQEYTISLIQKDQDSLPVRSTRMK